MMSEEDVSTFTGALSIRVLDAVNEAKRKLIDDDPWPFLNRSDGVLTTVDSFTGTTGTFTNGSATVSFPITDSPNSVVGDVAATDRVSRIVNTEDTVYGNQSFKILSGSVTATTFTGTIETTYPGTTFTATANYRVFVSEYLLPETVASVHSASIEGEDLSLVANDELWSYDDIQPVPHNEINLPRSMMVGGKSVATFDDTGSAADALTRLLLNPITDDEYVVRYKYRYQYPEMTATTDDLDGVPASTIDDIVRGGFAYMMMNSIGNDPALGGVNLAVVEQGRREKARARPDAGRASPLSAIDRRGRRNERGGILPRTITGL